MACGSLWLVEACGLWKLVACGSLWLVEVCGLWKLVACGSFWLDLTVVIPVEQPYAQTMMS